jgi:hypothetical protein
MEGLTVDAMGSIDQHDATRCISRRTRQKSGKRVVDPQATLIRAFGHRIVPADPAPGDQLPTRITRHGGPEG